MRLLYAAEPWLQRGPHDIIHCQFGTLGQLGGMLRNLYSPGAKLITSFRGYDISQRLRKYGDAVYRRLFDVGDLFLPNCDYFKERLIKLGCDEAKILVLHSGIDCHRFVFTPRYPHVNRPVRIVTTGRLTGKKGIEYGIRAVARLLKAGRNIRYDIIGDGPLKETSSV